MERGDRAQPVDIGRVLSSRMRTMRGKRIAKPEAWRLRAMDDVERDLDHDRRLDDPVAAVAD